MAINSALIGTTDTNLLVVPAGKSYAITTIMVCNYYTPNPSNPDEGKTNFDMHFIQSGQPRGNDNIIINQLELPAGETFTFDSEKIILEEGDTVVVLGDIPTNLSATISWLEV